MLNKLLALAVMLVVSMNANAVSLQKGGANEMSFHVGGAEQASLTTDGKFTVKTQHNSPLYCDEFGANCTDAASLAAAATGTVSPTGQMLSGFPDAIQCSDGTRVRTLHMTTSNVGGNTISYRFVADPATTINMYVIYLISTGAYNSSNQLAGYDCVDNTWSIADLYANNRAFNFTGENVSVGGGGSSIDELSDGKHDTDDYSSLFLGNGAGANDDGSDNQSVGVGKSALNANTTGTANSALGFNAMLSNQTGTENTALGWYALNSNTAGVQNVAIGATALNSNTVGGNNTAVGLNTLRFNVNGHYNTAIGSGAMYQRQAGNNNTAIGFEAMRSSSTVTSGNGNTALGRSAGFSIRTGMNDNLFLGTNAGYGQTGGSRNIVIGANKELSNSTGDDQLNIGNTIYGDLANDKVAIGTSTFSGTLALDVSGSIGAAEFCDENGANCTSAADLAAAAAGTVSPTGQMVAGFPDAIRCMAGSASRFLLLSYRRSDGDAIYRYISESTHLQLEYNSSGSYLTSAGMSTEDCVTNAWSIADLYTNDRAFNFTGENVSVGGGAGAVSLSDLLDAKADGSSYFIGDGAGAVDDGTANQNVGIGPNALNANTTGVYNIAIGRNALQKNVDGTRNTAIGVKALLENTSAIRNTAVGYGALYDTTTGSDNTAVGDAALQENTTGSGNVAVGRSSQKGQTGISTAVSNTSVGSESLMSVTSGGTNVAMGHAALYSNTTGAGNTAVGANSMYSHVSGNNNSAFGNYSLYTNSTGVQNSALGKQAMYANTTGGFNTAVGADALMYNTTGNGNAAFGYQAHYGQSGATTASSNTAIGYQAMRSVTTGYRNVALGSQALGSNTTGYDNVANGASALYSNTTGYRNIANGVFALEFNTTGMYNIGLGHAAMRNNTTGHSNIAIGRKAQHSSLGNSTGSYNVSLGYEANKALTTGSNNIAIGASVTVDNVAGNDQLNIGNTIYGDMATGRVGIGTSAPLQNIDVRNTTRASQIHFSGEDENTGGYLTSVPASQNDSAYLSGGMEYDGSDWIARHTEGWILGGQNGNVKIFTGTGSTVGNVANFTERLRVESGGQVGIGDTTPDGTLLLDVEGQVGATEYCDENGANCYDITTLAAGGGVSATGQIEAGWPDAIKCVHSNTSSAVLNYTGENSTGQPIFRLITTPTGTSDYTIRFNTNGTYDTNSNLSGYDCVTNSWSISDLYANDRAFNFTGENVSVGGGGSSIDELSDGASNSVSGTVFLGDGAGAVNTGVGNVAVGKDALNANTSGYQNVALGSYALNKNTTGYYNTATGYETLYNNIGGVYNTASGRQALYNNTSGASNIATGYRALFSNTTGGNNVATGYQALLSNTTGGSGVAVGYQALYRSQTGLGNVAMGYQTLAGTSSYTNASHNIGIGYQAGSNIGNNMSYNTFIGYRAGRNQTVGQNNIAIGNNVNLTNTLGSNQLNIGNVILGDLTNYSVDVSGSLIVSGAISTTAVNTTSDETLKENITTIEGALDKVSSIRGVEFDFRQDTTANLPEEHQIGVIAQEVKQVFPEVVKGEEGSMAVNYAALVAPLIEAVKELKERNEALEVRVKELESK